ncbi:MAG: hypothetical protein VXW87_00925 [Pseudomonadota bacterium]|nr:hypothetical protein [Pseudomonadota bacterium]
MKGRLQSKGVSGKKECVYFYLSLMRGLKVIETPNKSVGITKVV